MNKINSQSILNVKLVWQNSQNALRRYPTTCKQEEFKDVQALLYKFKDFQGLEVLVSNSRTFKYF
jgi:hypothetical protein